MLPITNQCVCVCVFWRCSLSTETWDSGSKQSSNWPSHPPYSPLHMHSMMVILVYITMGFYGNLVQTKLKNKPPKWENRQPTQREKKKTLSVKETPYWNSNLEVAKFKRLYDNWHNCNKIPSVIVQLQQTQFEISFHIKLGIQWVTFTRT